MPTTTVPTTVTTTTKPTTIGGGSTPTGVTTTLPASSGAVSSSAPITVSAGQSFDGGMKKYDRSRKDASFPTPFFKMPITT